MTIREDLIKEVEQAPDSLVEEVFNFLLFTKTRQEHDRTKSVASMDETPAADRSNTGESLLAMIDRITADMTAEEIAQLPTDGADQHDHYIYGIPKRQA
jgi:hypothetical protein